MNSHDEESLSEFARKKPQDFQRNQFTNQREEDLWHLSVWAKRLTAWNESEKAPGMHAGGIFLPHRTAADAMMRLSISYPHIIKQIDDIVDRAKMYLQNLHEGEHRSVSLAESMWALERRIQAAIQVMQAKQIETTNESKARSDVPENSKPRLTDLESSVLKAIIEHPDGIMGTRLTALTGAGQSTLTRHIIPKLKAHYGVSNQRGFGYYIESK